MRPTSAELDQESDVAFRSTLSLVVLGVAIGVANAPSLPLDLTPFENRLADGATRSLFALGVAFQGVAGIWLALSLLLDVRRGTRAALLVWLAALSLCLTPVPTVLEDFAAALVPLALVLLVTLLGWMLASSLREPAH